ncbi:hypothetical protein D7V97_00505 [Corallococcus sp. CA053C]|uniref:hypothetical protein n=1 Tax=Corallococcus sp. CA053C TaxID=2316732 RepID=UPI000EA23894|nr:hypothetical protein [Corallococcus sp. CA053C]RKH15321.1 hypothetical protein D7V97_00505 [Corallococcus sp. CA053C]
MANITVDLSTTPISYAPGPEVKQGDTVTFTLGSLPSSTEATVTFTDGTCLTVAGPYQLGGTHAIATSPLTVSNTAQKRPYPFDVVITNAPKDRKVGPGEHDRKNGGIDVTSEPPKEIR